MPKVKCEQCGEQYEVIPAKVDKSRFCSRQCKQDWESKNWTGKNNPNWNGGDVIVECKQCGSEFQVNEARSNTKFCSNECYGKWQVGKNNPNWRGGKVTLTCDWCGKSFKANPCKEDERKYCSTACRDDARRKEDSNQFQNWKHQVMTRTKYKQWRKEVFKRDDYRCRMCGSGDEIYPHHIISMRKIWDINKKQLAVDVSNGITLCKDCHALTLRNEEKFEKLFHTLLG